MTKIERENFYKFLIKIDTDFMSRTYLFNFVFHRKQKKI